MAWNSFLNILNASSPTSLKVSEEIESETKFVNFSKSLILLFLSLDKDISSSDKIEFLLLKNSFNFLYASEFCIGNFPFLDK